MSKYKYGRGKRHTFSTLTPVSENNSGIVAKLYYENYVSLGYKDFTKLFISCDKGPEICEEGLLPAVNLDTGEKVVFRVNKITHNEDANIWVMQLSQESNEN